MINYKTITERGKTVGHLNHEVKLMRTEKDVKINEVYEKMRNCTHMTVEAKYISSVSHTIALIRTWENERMSISYTNSAKPLQGVEFNYMDIESIEQLDNLYNHIAINLKAGTKIILS